jgi:hypothetical protein
MTVRAATDWQEVGRLRQEVRNAPSVPTRLAALFAYQSALYGFAEAHGAVIADGIGLAKERACRVLVKAG